MYDRWHGAATLSKWRRAARIDRNQGQIVKALRKIRGVTVQTGMDDLLVGYKGFTYWYELKEPEKVSKKTGELLESAIKPSQKKLRDTWKGHYRIVWSLDQILAELGIK
jgi:hypothetical protein